MDTRTVVTGLGVLAPTGVGAAEHWSRTVAGQPALGMVTRFDPSPYTSRVAGEVPLTVSASELPSRLLPQTDQMTRLALVAADLALRDAEVDPATLPDYAMGVVTAASAGGFDFGQRELEKLWSRGPDHVSAYQSFAWFYAVNTGQISLRHGMRGPSGVLVTDQAGGLDAVAKARRHVRQDIPLMMSGAVDGSPCPWAWVAQQTDRRFSRVTDPRRAYLPFDAEAAGYVPGEGGAILVLESERGARARGRTSSYGVVAGYAATFDPAPSTGRPSNLGSAVRHALRDAGLGPDEVDVVFADGAGTPDLDRQEADMIREVFGPYGVPVTVPKTMTGRLNAGGAALDLATALLAIRHGVVPPTVNVSDIPDDYQLDLVREPRETRLSAALVLARGRGGFNAAMVVTRG